MPSLSLKTCSPCIPRPYGDCGIVVTNVFVVGMIVLLLALVVTTVVLVVVVSNDDSHGGFGGGPLCLKCRHSAKTFALDNDAGWYIQLSQHCLSVTQPYPLGTQITQVDGLKNSLPLCLLTSAA